MIKKILLLLLFAIPIFATNYYVDGISGNDSNDGSDPENAVLTIGEILDGTPSLSAGDTIGLRTGSIFSEGDVSPTTSGTASSYIVFTNYDSTAGTFNIPDTSVFPSIIGTGNRCININNTSYISFYGIKLVHGGGATAGALVQGTSHDITFRKLKISNFNTSRGIWLGNFQDTPGDSVVIDSCDIYGCFAGIRGINFDYVTVSNCDIHDGNAGTDADGIYIQGYGAGDGCDGWIVEKNEIYNMDTGNSSDAMQIQNLADSLVFRYNYIHNCRGDGLVTENDWSGYIYGNVFVADNTSVAQTTGGMRIYEQIDDVYVYDNTFIVTAPSRTGLRIPGSDIPVGLTAHIKNNIFYLDGGGYGIIDQFGPLTESRFDIDYNDYYAVGSETLIRWEGTNYTSANFSSWQSVISDDANSATNNPLFNDPANDWALQLSSPCIDAATNLGATYDNAFIDGSDWPGILLADQDNYGEAWDIGAFLYQSPPDSVLNFTVQGNALGKDTAHVAMSGFSSINPPDSIYIKAKIGGFPVTTDDYDSVWGFDDTTSVHDFGISWDIPDDYTVYFIAYFDNQGGIFITNLSDMNQAVVDIDSTGVGAPETSPPDILGNFEVSSPWVDSLRVQQSKFDATADSFMTTRKQVGYSLNRNDGNVIFAFAVADTAAYKDSTIYIENDQGKIEYVTTWSAQFGADTAWTPVPNKDTTLMITSVIPDDPSTFTISCPSTDSLRLIIAHYSTQSFFDSVMIRGKVGAYTDSTTDGFKILHFATADTVNDTTIYLPNHQGQTLYISGYSGNIYGDFSSTVQATVTMATTPLSAAAISGSKYDIGLYEFAGSSARNTKDFPGWRGWPKWPKWKDKHGK